MPIDIVLAYAAPMGLYVPRKLVRQGLCLHTHSGMAVYHSAWSERQLLGQNCQHE